MGIRTLIDKGRNESPKTIILIESMDLHYTITLTRYQAKRPVMLDDFCLVPTAKNPCENSCENLSAKSYLYGLRLCTFLCWAMQER